jgi:hypothetical protein
MPRRVHPDAIFGARMGRLGVLKTGVSARDDGVARRRQLPMMLWIWLTV